MTVLRGLSDKVAIVTGGADSIGETVARMLHEAGVKTVIAARSADKGEAIVSELGERTRFVRTDLMQEDDIKALVSTTVDAFGGIDFIVNVACVYADAGCNSSHQDWMDTFKVNVVGGALLVREALPYLKKSNGASIVNFGSISGAIAQADRWTYPASKAAIEQLTRSQALDLANLSIRANTLRAGITWSVPVAGLSGQNRALADEVVSDYQPLGRLVEAEEVADAVLFLCSDNASSITGTVVNVDAGYGCLGPEGRVSVMEVMGKAAAEANDRGAE